MRFVIKSSSSSSCSMSSSCCQKKLSQITFSNLGKYKLSVDGEFDLVEDVEEGFPEGVVQVGGEDFCSIVARLVVHGRKELFPKFRGLLKKG